MKSSTLWPLGVGGVLLVTVVANLILFHVAGADPSFAIEPDYYTKAIRWDSTMAQERRNDALGWHLSPTLTPFAAKKGSRLSVVLSDSAGHQISGATVKVSAIFNARANHVLEATLTPANDGYTTTLDVEHGGQWELKFDVTRGTDRFTATTRVEAVPTASTSATAGSGT